MFSATRELRWPDVLHEASCSCNDCGCIERHRNPNTCYVIVCVVSLQLVCVIFLSSLFSSFRHAPCVNSKQPARQEGRTDNKQIMQTTRRQETDDQETRHSTSPTHTQKRYKHMWSVGRIWRGVWYGVVWCVACGVCEWCVVDSGNDSVKFLARCVQGSLLECAALPLPAVWDLNISELTAKPLDLLIHMARAACRFTPVSKWL